MAPRNPLDRRSQLLADTLERRTNKLFDYLVDAGPPGMVKKSPVNQVRDYIKMRDAGKIGEMRESMGGPYRDEDVDAYVGTMERELARHAPRVLLEDYAKPGTPLGGLMGADNE